MKSVFLVGSKPKSNHLRIHAAFESRHLAESYRNHRQRVEGGPYLTFVVLEVPALDGTPEMNRIMLGFPEGK